MKREITANENSVFVDLFDSILTFLDRLFSSSVFINTQITLFIHLVEKLRTPIAKSEFYIIMH